MKFYVPKFQIATLQAPQRKFRSKFGGLPWGLPLKQWSRCQQCGRLMSLLAQLSHDPPALDFGGPEYVLHLFQCQECYGYESGEGNDAIMVPTKKLGSRATQFPSGEDLRGVLGPELDQMVGELWIDGWKEEDDGLDPALAIELYDQNKWSQLPKRVTNSMFEERWRTKMGGVPYWTGNGPLQTPSQDYEFLFQLDTRIKFDGSPPKPDDVGGVVFVPELVGKGSKLQCNSPSSNKKQNAPRAIIVDDSKKKFSVEITNFGTDGTAYVFINRKSKPAEVYWFWNR